MPEIITIVPRDASRAAGGLQITPLTNGFNVRYGRELGDKWFHSEKESKAEAVRFATVQANKLEQQAIALRHVAALLSKP